MDMEEATRIVKEQQTNYLRGDMTPARINEIEEMYPQAIPDWNRMKLNLTVRKNKLAKQVKDILLASKNKSKDCKRFRPGKQKSTLKQLNKRLHKAKNKFSSGVDVLLTWTEFMNEICVSLGTKIDDIWF